MCCSVGVQIANVSRHVLMKPEILCGSDPIHPSGGRSAQLNDWRFVVFLSQLWMKSWEVTVARLKLEETPLLDKVFICRSLLSFYSHGAGGPWCLASPANGSQLWSRRTFLASTRAWDSFSTLMLHSFPGLITARDLVEDIFLQLDCQNFPLASKVAKTILHTALYQLQLYWVDTQLRGLLGFSQGPQWRSQMRRGRTLATQSRKRITGFGKFGIGYHIPPGCGKMEHLRLSSL